MGICTEGVSNLEVVCNLLGADRRTQEVMGTICQNEGAPWTPGYLARKTWLLENSLQALIDSAVDIETLKAKAIEG